MRGHARTHDVRTSPAASLSLMPKKKRKKEKKRNAHTKTHTFAMNEIKERSSWERRTDFSRLFWARHFPHPPPLFDRTTWDFLGHGPATLNSSLDVIIHIHIYLYFYQHVCEVCMYIYICFPRFILSFLVPRYPSIVILSLSLFLSRSLAHNRTY